jgi:hypothetical protein
VTLQASIDQHYSTNDLHLRLKWFCQAAENIKPIEKRGHHSSRPATRAFFTSLRFQEQAPSDIDVCTYSIKRFHEKF